MQIPEATPTTVRAVVSTVNSGASKPHLVITETLSTIDFEVIMVVLIVVVVVITETLSTIDFEVIRIRRGGVYSGGW